MAKPPKKTKTRRAIKSTGKGTTRKGRRKARAGGFSLPAFLTGLRKSLGRVFSAKALSWTALKPRLASWLDHAGARFSMGIGIGLLAGLIAVMSFGHIGKWIDRHRAPESGQYAVQEAAPKIVEAPAPKPVAQKPVEQKPVPPVQPKPVMPPIVEPDAPASTPSAPQAPAATAGMAANQQMPNQSMSEITEPEAAQQLDNPQTAVPPSANTAPPAPSVPIEMGSKPNDQPAWLRNSVAMRAPANGPMIAIILDDVGVVKSNAEQAIELPAPITLSMMTYADGVADMAARAHAKGHELMLHVPMQPVNGKVDPGPNALLVGLPTDEIRRRLDWGLDRFSGFIGINNHMGSRFTQDEAGMRIVMQELRARGLLFLDSKTIPNSVGGKVAREMGVPHVDRDVFLDDDMAPAAVARQLALTERVARKQGYAIAIGHPHPATVAVLKQWIVEAKQRGFVLVPLSAIARRENGVTG